MILSFIILIITLIANWILFQKMGREGWESIIPFYNQYVLFEELYGNGWKFLLLLIPFYNIYVCIKLNIDLAHGFHKSTGFGIGLLFLSFIFLSILAFSSATYGTITSPISADDPVSKVLDKVSTATTSPRKDPEALNKLRELSAMRDNNIITEEEFQQKNLNFSKKYDLTGSLLASCF